MTGLENEVLAEPVTDRLPPRDRILELQDALVPFRIPLPEPEHYFAPGMYGRTLEIPAGMLVVGKTHRHQHLMMVLKGHAVIITEFGRDEVKAGHISVSQPGAKRVVLALEDTLFVTVHHNPSNTEDLEDIEAEHIVAEDFTRDLAQMDKELAMLGVESEQ
jgi:hypothetical protein